MAPVPIAPLFPLGGIAAVVAASFLAVCGDGSARSDSAGGRPRPRAAAHAAVRAPADTVDSLVAARRATVLDTTTVKTGAAPKARSDGADSTQDSTPLKKPRAALGAKAGSGHPAYRGVDARLDSLWPVKGPDTLPGSILPARRIVAFYGNPLSTRMGILGATGSEEMLRRLDAEVAAWNRVDPAHPVQPALHLIVLVADGVPGTSGKYRTRHDSAMIEKVYGWARSRNALLFLDLQVGQSTLQQELPWVEKFLVRPDVHLGIDPEFSMKKGGIPGKRVGTYDAVDVNYASSFLAKLVDKHKLPPKVLVVHRFTPGGVTNTKKISLDPRVQIVMHMDGFGAPWVKRDTYWRDIKREPVQYTGWKQFSKLRNDKPPTPRGDILRLWPVPLYIQVQ